MKSHLIKPTRVKRRTSRRIGGATTSTIVNPSKRVLVSPDTVFVFNRRIADAVMYVDSTGTAQFPVPLNPTATNWMFFGTGLSDQIPGTVYQPFGMQLTLTSLSQSSDLQQMFAEYQILESELEAQVLQNTANSGGSIMAPELLMAVDPNGTVPGTVPALEAYGNVKRAILSTEKTYKMRCVPRPAMELFTPGSPPTLSFGYIAQNLVWLNMANNTIPHYGFIGIIRNLNGTSSNFVRLGGTVKIAVRRPR